MPDAPGAVRTNIKDQRNLILNSDRMSFSIYGAGNPLPPVVDGQTPRRWDFSPGYNQSITPRRNEPFGFTHLRAFANVELVRMAIETRKDQLEKQDWMVKPRDNGKARAKERDPRCVEIEKFLSKPDGATLFPSFMRALDEDLLAIDAASIELRRRRNGKLFGLEFVDGATINRLIGDDGRPPREPDSVAFQQIVRGVVWANLKNTELLYLPRNVRSGHVYGFSPVEQIIVTIQTIINRQASQLAYFTKSNVPAGLLTAPDGWTLEQIKELQEWLNQLISGNIDVQRQLLWTPHGTEYKSFKDAPVKDEFDEWLARIVAFAFSLPPTPFIRQMNKGTAGEDQERALEEGLEPLKRWRERWISDLIATEFGAPDLEFAYIEDSELDAAKQSEIDDRALKNGSAVIDEVRDRRGEDPLPNGLGSRPMIYLGDTPIPLESIDGLIERKLEPPAPPVMPGGDQGAANGVNQPPKKGKKGGKGPKAKPVTGAAKRPAKAAVEKLEKAARIPPPHALALSIDRPKAARARHALAKAIRPIFAKAAIDVAAQIERDLKKADRDPGQMSQELARALDLSVLLGLEKPLADEMEEIGVDAVRLALASVGVDAESDLVNQVNEKAVAYARARAADLVSLKGDESLIESTRETIRGIIASGLEDNVGRDAIADQIQSATAFSEFRAELIADTEIANANSAAKLDSWNAVEADGQTLVKEWFVSGDEGVCEECESNESQGEIAFDESFDSGDDMEPAHPGCRCVTTARVLDPGESADEGAGAEE
jgi:hypothetical protein